MVDTHFSVRSPAKRAKRCLVSLVVILAVVAGGSVALRSDRPPFLIKRSIASRLHLVSERKPPIAPISMVRDEDYQPTGPLPSFLADSVVLEILMAKSHDLEIPRIP